MEESGNKTTVLRAILHIISDKSLLTVSWRCLEEDGEQCVAAGRVCPEADWVVVLHREQCSYPDDDITTSPTSTTTHSG